MNSSYYLITENYTSRPNPITAIGVFGWSYHAWVILYIFLHRCRIINYTFNKNLSP